MDRSAQTLPIFIATTPYHWNSRPSRNTGIHFLHVCLQSILFFLVREIGRLHIRHILPDGIGHDGVQVGITA